KNPCQRDFEVTEPSQGVKATLVAIPLPGAGPQALSALNEAVANFEKLAKIERVRLAFTETPAAAAPTIVPENPRLNKRKLTVLTRKMETDLSIAQNRAASGTQRAKIALNRLEEVVARMKEFPNH